MIKSRRGIFDKIEFILISGFGWWEVKFFRGIYLYIWGVIYNYYGNIIEKWRNRRFEGEKKLDKEIFINFKMIIKRDYGKCKG